MYDPKAFYTGVIILRRGSIGFTRAAGTYANWEYVARRIKFRVIKLNCRGAHIEVASFK